MSETPDPIATARRLFASFATEAAGGAGPGWYATVAPRIAEDDALVGFAIELLDGQPAPNMLFAAVQYLIEDHPDDPLADWYPALCGNRPPAPGDPFEAFRTFCLANEQPIRHLLSTRRVQTNEVRRSTGLAVALAELARTEAAPLELIDLGASAGFTLNFDRFDHHLGDLRWGDPASLVRVDVELRGEGVPPLPDHLSIATRWGVDLHPVDVTSEEEARWLRALVYPTHTDRRALLDAAIDVTRRDPVSLVAGDLVDVLLQRLPLIPSDRAICLVASYVLHQLLAPNLVRLWALLATHARTRPIHLVQIAGYRNDPNGYIRLLNFDGDTRTRRTIANVNPHGLWLEYLPNAPAKPW